LFVFLFTHMTWRKENVLYEEQRKFVFTNDNIHLIDMNYSGLLPHRKDNCHKGQVIRKNVVLDFTNLKRRRLKHIESSQSKTIEIRQ
jgi:hypothetical protein